MANAQEHHRLSKAQTSLVLHSAQAFFVKQDEYTVRIRHRDIMWLKADGNYTLVNCVGKKRPMLLVHNLGRVEELLPQRLFVRISRSVIVNTHFIDRMCGNALYIKDQSFKIK